MHTRRLPPVILLLGLLAIQPAASADPPRPLAVEDALAQLSFAYRIPIDVSPDGEWVAYTIQDPRRRESAGQERYSLFSRTGVSVEAQACDVWITRIATGETRNLTGGRGSSWGPVWSPNGRALAFYSDRDGEARLWIWSAASDRSRPVSAAVVRPLFVFEVPRWTPDGTRILTKVLPEGLTLEKAADLLEGAGPGSTTHDAKDGVTAVVYRSSSISTLGQAKPGAEPSAWMNASLADLALIDVEIGTVDRIVKQVRPRGYWISPNGSSVALTTLKGDESWEILFDLCVRSLKDGSTRVVAPGLSFEYGITVSWSPDGTRLAFLTGGMKAGGECFLVDASGGDPVSLTSGKHPDFSQSYRPPLWDADGRSIYVVGEGDLWKLSVGERTCTRITQGGGPPIKDVLAAGHSRLWSPDAVGSAIVATRDEATKRVGYDRINLQSGRRARLLDEDKHYDSAIFSTRVTRDGTRILYLAEDSQHGADLWSAAPDFHDPRRVTRINRHLDNYAFGKSRVVHWRGIDGEALRGALLLPANYREGRRYPLVVEVYGGGTLSDDVNRFGLSGMGVDNRQLLATRSIAVLAVDAPVRPGTPARDLLKAVMPGVDQVVNMGIADPDRLGVMGHSFGGYSTLALITQTSRFRAAVTRAGPTDWVSAYGQMDKDGSALKAFYCEADKSQPGLGGPPWQYPQRYIENSPIFHLDRVRTPLLLIHGGVDTSVPPSQSEEVFVGLSRLGREVTYVRYEGEGHYEAHWRHANAADYLTRALNFFERHLCQPRGHE
jgi:dipeptidyl aminopeptidase/acylaminoacyl peptidase